jgi:hypothetical protein
MSFSSTNSFVAIEILSPSASTGLQPMSTGHSDKQEEKLEGRISTYSLMRVRQDSK